MVSQTMYRLGAGRSCIRELFEYGLSRAKIVGKENIFDFSLGNPSLPAPKAVEDAIKAVLAENPSTQVHGYTPAPGDAAVRQAVAENLRSRFGCDAGPEDLFLGCGAAPEIVSVIRALCVENAEFVAIAPYFPEYKPFVECSGGMFRVVPPDVPDFQIDLAALERTLNEHTQAVILNSPNNPSGSVYTPETLHSLAKLLWKTSEQFGHPIYLLSDEPYRELVYDGKTVPYVPDFYPNTVICYSWSKSLSLPGERIGYVYVPKCAADHDELYAAVCGAARSIGHVCAPSLLQKVIGRCIGLSPDLAGYDKNRRLLWEGLTALGYETARPDGAFYLFVKAPGGDAKAFSERAKLEDVLVVPGDDFGCPGYVRLCFCVTEDCIRRSLPKFEKLLNM